MHSMPSNARSPFKPGARAFAAALPSAPELKGHRDVLISWFASERPQPLGLSYASLLENYDPADGFRMYSEGAIDELFTRAEADAPVSFSGAGPTKLSASK
jgi:hypothetical protein